MSVTALIDELTSTEVAARRRSGATTVIGPLGATEPHGLHTALAHPACTIAEFIPWIRPCFEEPIVVKDGLFVPPLQAGAGSTVTSKALEDFRSQMSFATSRTVCCFREFPGLIGSVPLPPADCCSAEDLPGRQESRLHMP